jgi:CheY-like chemotaxis protein
MSEDKKKILVIDDEFELLMAMKIRLKASGYDVTTTQDGIEGIGLIEQLKPDIVLLDFIMPNNDGLEICKRIKTNPRIKDIPVFMFTAAGEKNIEERIKEAGAQGHITKPFDTANLLTMIKKWL